MALLDILNRITVDARTEADGIVLAAELAASEFRKDAQARAELERGQHLARGRAEAEALAGTQLASARLTERDRTLAEKRELMQRVFAGAVARIEALPDQEYAALIAREVKRAARGGERLVIGHADAKRLGAHLSEALAREQVEIEIAAGSSAPSGTGVVLIGERMRVEISASALVDSHADRLTAVASEVLFGGSHDAGREVESL